ncbi:MAG TPA: universal stress protein [Gemmatimonadales bacterium]
MTLTKSSQPPAAKREEFPPLILLPLDGSRIAEQALPMVGTIAHRGGTKVHLASVVPQAPIFLASGEEPVPDPGLEQELRDQLTEYLRSTAEALETTHGVEVTYALLDGAPAQALADHARAKRVGLIVMTTHGHSGITRFWLGSVADRLLRWVKMPLLLLRPTHGALQTEFRHTLVALDGLSEGERVLEPAIALGSLCPDAQFTLVQVVEPPVPLITRMAMQPAKMRPHWREQQENCARSYLERAAKTMRARGLSVSTQMVSAGGIGEQILGLAHEIGADLIVVGTHGTRGVERMLLGSVADKVVRGATGAVLVVPTQKEDG